MLRPLPWSYDSALKHDLGGTASCSSSEITGEHQHGVSLQALSALDVCVSAVEGLDADEPSTRSRAARELAELVERSYSDDAELIGAYIRESGGIELLVELLADPEPSVHQKALMVLGNLLSDGFDPHSWRTKQALYEQANEEEEEQEEALTLGEQLAHHLVAHLDSASWPTQMYAAALVQNAAQHRMFAKSFVDAGGLKRLRKLLSSTQPVVVRFAAGGLKNIADSFDTNDVSVEPAAETGAGDKAGETAEGQASSSRGLRSGIFSNLRSATATPLKALSERKKRKPALLMAVDVQAAVTARIAEDAEQKAWEAEAATMLQTAWRGHVGRAASAQRVRELQAKLVILRHVRRSPWLERHRLHAAAMRVQRIWRGRRPRVRRARQLQAALTIQSGWRGFLGRQRAAKWRLLREVYAEGRATLGPSAPYMAALNEAERSVGAEGALMLLGHRLPKEVAHLTSKLLAENERLRRNLKERRIDALLQEQTVVQQRRMQTASPLPSAYLLASSRTGHPHARPSMPAAGLSSTPQALSSTATWPGRRPGSAPPPEIPSLVESPTVRRPIDEAPQNLMAADRDVAINQAPTAVASPHDGYAASSVAAEGPREALATPAAKMSARRMPFTERLRAMRASPEGLQRAADKAARAEVVAASAASDATASRAAAALSEAAAMLEEMLDEEAAATSTEAVAEVESLQVPTVEEVSRLQHAIARAMSAQLLQGDELDQARSTLRAAKSALAQVAALQVADGRRQRTSELLQQMGATDADIQILWQAVRAQRATEHAAARTIQKHTRRMWAVELLRRALAAAVTIEAAARRMLGMRYLRRSVQAAVAIQSVGRCNLARARLAGVIGLAANEGRWTAAKSGRPREAARGVDLVQAEAGAMMRRHRSATLLQARARSLLSTRHLSSRRAAALLLVCAGAAMLARGRLRSARYAATLVQSVVRGRVARRWCHALHSERVICGLALRWSARRRRQLQLAAALALEAVARGLLARCRLRQAKRAATVLSALGCGHLVRMQLRATRQASLVVQAAVRTKTPRLQLWGAVAAAVGLQAAIRGGLARCRLRAARHAATELAALLRGGLVRRRWKRATRAATCVQSFARGLAARHQRTFALIVAIAMQAAAKGLLARRRYRRRLRRARLACTTVAAFARGNLARQQFLRSCQAAILVQSSLRGHVARRNLATAIAAALAIQAGFRRMMALGLLRSQRHAAVVVEAAARGHVARQQLRLGREAAVVAQAWWRGLLPQIADWRRARAAARVQAVARCGFALHKMRRVQRATLALQAVARGMSARRLLTASITGAVLVQAALRGRRARRLLACHRWAALVLESGARAKPPRRALRGSSAAVLVLQASARGLVSRGRLRQRCDAQARLAAAARGQISRMRLRRSRVAAVTLESAWRGASARSRLRLHLVAALALAAGTRGWLGRRRLREARWATTAVVALGRGCVARAGLRRSVQAAARLQAVGRGVAARRNLSTAIAAAIAVQAGARRVMACALLRRQRHAAAVMEAAAKGHVARQRLRRTRRAVTVLRAHAVALPIRRVRRVVLVAAVAIEAAARARAVRRKAREQRRGCIVLQAVGRGMAPRRLLKHARSAAAMMQAEARVRPPRKALQLAITAAVAVEAATRARAARAVLERRRRASVLMQAGVRAATTRQRLRTVRRAAVAVQTTVRAKAPRLALRRALAAAICVQAAARRLISLLAFHRCRLRLAGRGAARAAADVAAVSAALLQLETGRAAAEAAQATRQQAACTLQHAARRMLAATSAGHEVRRQQRNAAATRLQSAARARGRSVRRAQRRYEHGLQEAIGKPRTCSPSSSSLPHDGWIPHKRRPAGLPTSRTRLSAVRHAEQLAAGRAQQDLAAERRAEASAEVASLKRELLRAQAQLRAATSSERLSLRQATRPARNSNAERRSALVHAHARTSVAVAAPPPSVLPPPPSAATTAAAVDEEGEAGAGRQSRPLRTPAEPRGSAMARVHRSTPSSTRRSPPAQQRSSQSRVPGRRVAELPPLWRKVQLGAAGSTTPRYDEWGEMRHELGSVVGASGGEAFLMAVATRNQRSMSAPVLPVVMAPMVRPHFPSHEDLLALQSPLALVRAWGSRHEMTELVYGASLAR